MLIKSTMLQQLQRSSSDTALTLKDRKRQQFWHVYDYPVTVRNILSRYVWQSGSVFKTLLSVIQSTTYTYCVSLSKSFLYIFSHLSFSGSPALKISSFTASCHWPDSSLKKKTQVNTEPQTFVAAWGMRHERSPLCWITPLRCKALYIFWTSEAKTCLEIIC